MAFADSIAECDVCAVGNIPQLAHPKVSDQARLYRNIRQYYCSIVSAKRTTNQTRAGSDACTSSFREGSKPGCCRYSIGKEASVIVCIGVTVLGLFIAMRCCFASYASSHQYTDGALKCSEPLIM